MQKYFFEILALTALTVGLIWTILELTPKSALLSFTILYLTHTNYVTNFSLKQKITTFPIKSCYSLPFVIFDSQYSKFLEKVNKCSFHVMVGVRY